MKKRRAMKMTDDPSATDPRANHPPQIGGGDIELGNFITGVDSTHSGLAAARLVLGHVEGVGNQSASPYPAESSEADSSKFNPQDWMRKWSTVNGSCTYIDLQHVEIALPEITSAREFLTYWHAMLLRTMRAREEANRHLPNGQRVELLATNSDGHGSSWGAHLNFCLPRRAYDQLLHEKMQNLLFLAGYQASSLIFTGQGKVGSENDRPPVSYQLSQRADFFCAVSGWQTTYRRPIVNLRDEGLLGRPSPAGRAARPADKWARLHCIFYDSTLCHVATYLKFGVMQIVLEMIADEPVDSGLLLENPLQAVLRWSHDVSLQHREPLLSGGSATALELQLRILERARRFVERGRCNIADAPHLLDLWEDTLAKLKAADWEALAPRLDWVRKLMLIRHAMHRNARLDWRSTEIKMLDHLWASLSPRQGLFWAIDRAGGVERIVSEEQIAQAMLEPPSTRAWARAALLRMAAPGEVKTVDWDSITFNVSTDGSPATRTLELPDPHFTRGQFERLTQGCGTLEEMLDALGAPPPISSADANGEAAYSSYASYSPRSASRRGDA
jgi:proteasome accessory factor A